MTNFFSDRIAARLPFFYGYVMMPVAMLVQICTSPGQTFAISAFTPALRESLALSDSRLSAAYMLGTLLAAVPLSVVGPLSDRWGLRPVTSLAVISLAGACYFASRASGFLTLLAAFFLLRFLGQGTLTLLSGNTVAMWFRARIGRVSAVISVGTALAFAWVPAWLSASIDLYGWRWTYQAMAVVIMLPILVLLFRNRPEDVGQNVDGLARSFDQAVQAEPRSGVEPSMPSLDLRAALRGRAFYLLAGANALWAMAGTGVLFYLFTLCADRGVDDDVPADLFKTFGLTMLVAQLLGGVLSDFLPLNRLLGIGVTMLALGLGILYRGGGVVPLHSFAALFGGG